MDNFMIGHYGHFDSDKQSRDYIDTFWGVEACLLADDTEVEKLNQSKRACGYNIGIHFPLLSGRWNHRDPQYMSLDNHVRQASYDYMNEDIAYANKVSPSYVLIHYPKPVVLDPRVDWHGWGWRFSDPSEYVSETEIDKETFIMQSDIFFRWFSDASIKYSFEPVIELDAIPPYLYEDNLLPKFLEKYPNIKVCADIGRFHLQSKIDPNFDPFAFLDSIKDYVTQVHLWNICVTDKVSHSHYPALPTLTTQNGWADIESYFRILNACKNKPRILFEHDSSQITSQELQTCYDWVSQLQNKKLKT